MAFIPTVLAFGLGGGFGISQGGSLRTAQRWWPQLWQVGAAGVGLLIAMSLFGFSGPFGFLLTLAGYACLGAFAFSNLRTGGMIVVLVGVIFNVVPLLINGGTPVSASALTSAGLVSEADVASGQTLELNGARHVADSGDHLKFLGEIMALPTGQVISFGDLLLFFGYGLVTAAVFRGRVLR